MIEHQIMCDHTEIRIYVTHSTCDLPSGAIRPVRSGRVSVPADVTGQESTDWLQLLWNFVATLVAPDDEEEGIHQLTETLTRKGACSRHYKITISLRRG